MFNFVSNLSYFLQLLQVTQSEAGAETADAAEDEVQIPAEGEEAGRLEDQDDGVGDIPERGDD